MNKEFIIFVDAEDEKCECDNCDEKKPCVHFNTIGNDIFILCKDCVKILFDSFKTESIDEVQLVNIDVLNNLEKEFPNNKIEFSPVTFVETTFTPVRMIIIDGKITNINLTPDYIQDMTSCYSPSQREILTPIIEQIKEYLETKNDR